MMVNSNFQILPKINFKNQILSKVSLKSLTTLKSYSIESWTRSTEIIRIFPFFSRKLIQISKSVEKYPKTLPDAPNSILELFKSLPLKLPESSSNGSKISKI